MLDPTSHHVNHSIKGAVIEGLVHCVLGVVKHIISTKPLDSRQPMHTLLQAVYEFVAMCYILVCALQQCVDNTHACVYTLASHKLCLKSDLPHHQLA